jgi:cellulose synthase/poly-beta-1,6-N-acetylglucosamine synthase-like glycosyltransferase
MFEGQSEFYLFAVFSTIIWALWLLKVLLSRRYKPYTGEFHGTTSVVIPVVDEPLDLFHDVLSRIVGQQPDEVIVVINGKRNPGLERVSEEFAPLVRWVHTPIPGKRNAVKIGTEMSHGEITVLVDSDTVWTDGTLPELVKPFADPAVGGVTTRQRILDPERSWITRWADWLENSRALYSMPAQSALGQVGCLPGRTIAFRRHILIDVMDDFMHEKPSDFLRLPVFIIVSTFFLMPVRLLGFLRMAHASGWGTRAGAYAGGDLMEELEQAPQGPVDLVDRAPDGVVPHQRSADGTVLTEAPARVRRATAAPAPAPAPRRRRRLNPLAGIPYVAAVLIFALEALVYV